MKVAVLGGGAWGSVLANLAVRHGHDVALWELDAAAASALATQRTSARAVGGFRLADGVAVSSDLEASVGPALAERGLIVVAIPVAAVRATLARAARVASGGGAMARFWSPRARGSSRRRAPRWRT